MEHLSALLTQLYAVIYLAKTYVTGLDIVMKESAFVSKDEVVETALSSVKNIVQTVKNNPMKIVRIVHESMTAMDARYISAMNVRAMIFLIVKNANRDMV